MTEEDTFNKLRKISFKDLQDLIIRHYCTTDATSVSDEFFRAHGWTSQDYKIEWIEWHHVRESSRGFS